MVLDNMGNEGSKFPLESTDSIYHSKVLEGLFDILPHSCTNKNNLYIQSDLICFPLSLLQNLPPFIFVSYNETIWLLYFKKIPNMKSYSYSNLVRRNKIIDSEVIFKKLCFDWESIDISHLLKTIYLSEIFLF